MSETETETAVEEKELSAEDQEIMDAFVSSAEEGADEDETKMSMCMAGAKFKNVGRLYNQYMVTYGYSASKEAKAEAVAEAADNCDFETEEGFNEGVYHISNNVNGITPESAASLIRAYCKKEEIDVYKKPKGSRGLRSDGFKFKFYKLMRENPATTADELSEFVKSNGSENDIRYMSTHQAIRQLCNDIVS